jgi:hypothetical protein
MPWGVAAAAVVGAYSANKQAKAAKSAANAQAQSADRAADVQWDMFNQSRADNEPWRQAGLTAQSQILSLLGLPQQNVAQAISQSAVSTKPQTWFGDNGGRDEMAYYNDPNYRAAWDEVARFHNYDPNNAFTRRGEDRGKIAAHMQQVYNQRIQGAQKPAAAGGAAAKPLTQQQAFDAFRATPGYQFGLTEGVRALDSSAAASGGLFSGKAAKALTKFGTDYADQQGYRPYMSNLFQLAGYGQTATAQNQQAGQQAASNVGNALMSAGNARASGITGGANAWGGFANGIAGLAGQYAANKNGWGWGGI